MLVATRATASFLLLALPLGGLRLALSLALRRPCLALRFPFSGPCLARCAHALPWLPSVLLPRWERSKRRR